MEKFGQANKENKQPPRKKWLHGVKKERTVRNGVTKSRFKTRHSKTMSPQNRNAIKKYRIVFFPFHKKKTNYENQFRIESNLKTVSQSKLKRFGPKHNWNRLIVESSQLLHRNRIRSNHKFGTQYQYKSNLFFRTMQIGRSNQKSELDRHIGLT